MARQSLIEFQRDLSKRLAAAASAQERPTALLAMRSGEQTWLLALTDAGEALPVPKLAPAPLTKAWYVGLANVRGNLYSVIDFGAFCGARPVRPTPSNRLILCGQRFGLNVGLLVDGVEGLRQRDDLQSVTDLPSASAIWLKAVCEDAAGRRYHELDAEALVRDSEFMNVGL